MNQCLNLLAQIGLFANGQFGNLENWSSPREPIFLRILDDRGLMVDNVFRVPMSGNSTLAYKSLTQNYISYNVYTIICILLQTNEAIYIWLSE